MANVTDMNAVHTLLYISPQENPKALDAEIGVAMSSTHLSILPVSFSPPVNVISMWWLFVVGAMSSRRTRVTDSNLDRIHWTFFSPSTFSLHRLISYYYIVSLLAQTILKFILQKFFQSIVGFFLISHYKCSKIHHHFNNNNNNNNNNKSS